MWFVIHSITQTLAVLLASRYKTFTSFNHPEIIWSKWVEYLTRSWLSRLIARIVDGEHISAFTAADLRASQPTLAQQLRLTQYKSVTFCGTMLNLIAQVYPRPPQTRRHSQVTSLILNSPTSGNQSYIWDLCSDKSCILLVNKASNLYTWKSFE